jgi:hypothetical protein
VAAESQHLPGVPRCACGSYLPAHVGRVTPMPGVRRW